MGLKEKALKYRQDDIEVKASDKIQHLEDIYAGRALTRTELQALKTEINTRIDSVTSQLDRKLIDMQTLFEIGRELNSTLHVTDLMQIIIFTLMGQYQLSDVAIFSIHEEHANFIGNNGFTELISFPVSPQFIQYLSDEACALGIEDIKNYPEEYGHLSAQKVAEIIPMKGKENIIGFIVTGQKMSGQAFSDDEKEFTYTMASLAGIALENAMLYDELNQKYSELSTLYDVSRVINSSDDYELVLSLILETITTGFGVKKALLFDVDESGYKTAKIVGLDESLLSRSFQLNDEMNGLMDKNQVEIVNLEGELAELLPNHSQALFVPLNSVGTKVGGLIILESEKYAIKKSATGLVSLYAIIASQIAPPIFMTRMIKEENEMIRDPFTPVVDLIQSEIEKAESFGMDATLAMLKLTNFGKYIEFYGGEAAQEKFDALSRKLKEIVPTTAQVIRYSSNRVLFIMPALADSDWEEIKDSILTTSQSIFKDEKQVDIGLDLLSAKYPNDAQNKYALLALIE